MTDIKQIFWNYLAHNPRGLWWMYQDALVDDSSETWDEICILAAEILKEKEKD